MKKSVDSKIVTRRSFLKLITGASATASGIFLGLISPSRTWASQQEGSDSSDQSEGSDSRDRAASDSDSDASDGSGRSSSDSDSSDQSERSDSSDRSASDSDSDASDRSGR